MNNCQRSICEGISEKTQTKYVAGTPVYDNNIDVNNFLPFLGFF